jgi:hypothetical protein
VYADRQRYCIEMTGEGPHLYRPAARAARSASGAAEQRPPTA